MGLAVGQQVEHRNDPAMGGGKVIEVMSIAGVSRVTVRWSGAGLREHREDDLLGLVPLPDRLAAVGAASRIPFQLKVLGMWFESRHSLTGELSNQPFQMLPHQVIVTNRVVNSRSDDRAWLVADDVGLGKTIEAGMIMEVLRKKTLGRFRCLIVTPAGLMPQWKDELERRFHRAFRFFNSKEPNDLEQFDQLLASIDTLKLAKSRPALAQTTPWDLVIFDEAHHLATESSVQAHQLAQYMRTEKKARNLLFLSATPHSGNNEHFFNMLRILREDLFPKGRKDYPEVKLSEVMIRNRKSDIRTVEGEKIFNGTTAKRIEFEPSEAEVEFYEELREYLRTGYKAVQRLEKQKNKQRAVAVGFLMSTFGKLASSSREAIRSALQNRMAALEGEAEEGEAGADSRFEGENAEGSVRTRGLEPSKGKKKTSPIEGELAHVKSLIEKLDAVRGEDSKLTAFLRRVDTLESDVKLLIFTEYRATQTALVNSLRAKYGHESVEVINGSMDMIQRRAAVEAFNERRPNPRFMVSTEAGGEGLNMQKSCHTVVNYDVPWNPMNLQQRIGRVYRYGQKHPVVVFNLKVVSTSEAFADQRVYEYLEKKIDEITNQLGKVQDGDPEDLRGEVLGQVAKNISLDELYRTAVEEGRKKAEHQVDAQAGQIQEIMANPEGMLGLFRGLSRFDLTAYNKVAARVSAEHLDFFVRRYLGREGAMVTDDAEGLMTFRVPKQLVEIAARTSRTDPYSFFPTLTENDVTRATVDKKRAQQVLGCRLLRFGDVVFETMVSHVKHGGYGDAVASLELPAQATGWKPGDEGTWVLFELRVRRDEGMGGPRLLRHELASFLIPKGGAPMRDDQVVESLHRADDGPGTFDREEVARAYTASQAAATARLTELRAEVVAEFGTDQGIVPEDVQDAALAWLQAC